MLTKPRLAASGWRRISAITAAALVFLPAVYVVAAPSGMAVRALASRMRVIEYRGYQVRVPSHWRIVDLASHPHACVRFDRPAVYLGAAGDQNNCPAHLIGGSPALQIEPLSSRSVRAGTRPLVTAMPSGAAPGNRLPSHGSASIIVPAGVLVTAQYGARDAALLRRIVTEAQVSVEATAKSPAPIKRSWVTPSAVTAPGSYLGRGFDTCTAPSQSTMDAWLSSSPYGAVGVYIGGVNRGCGQPHLTASWVSRQVKSGWHLIPTYVGLQAPCSRFYNRVSRDVPTARAQGNADGKDAVTQAKALGIAAPSTLFADMEGYDNTKSSCVRAVLTYLSGWAHSLHTNGYRAGVYSGAASGMSDLSAHYNSTRYIRPDDIWVAWWNSAANVDGGTYVPDTQWGSHQRIHQYAGNVSETYAGYRMSIDRDYLDMGAVGAVGKGCPTNLNFADYPVLQSGDIGPPVAAAQCLLSKRGFNPGSATGTFNPRTAAAVGDFKVSKKLNNDSVLGRRAWTALLSAGRSPHLKLQSSGPGVRKLQRSLTASLQRSVTISGTFDRSTRRAVVQYQKANGLTADGTVGSSTWKALHAGR